MNNALLEESGHCLEMKYTKDGFVAVGELNYKTLQWLPFGDLVHDEMTVSIDYVNNDVDINFNVKDENSYTEKELAQLKKEIENWYWVLLGKLEKYECFLEEEYSDYDFS